MNALLSFKRTGKSGSASGGTPKSHAADPLMNSNVMLDEIPEEHFSTLKFLDIKREEAAKRDAETTQTTETAASSTPVATSSNNAMHAVADTAARAAANVTATTNTATPANGKPSRMQVFKDRVVIERQEAVTLPFLATGKNAAGFKQINLTAMKSADHGNSPIRTLLQNGLQIQASNIQNASVASNPVAHSSKYPASADTTINADTAAHLKLATHSSFCLTRSSESLHTVIGQYLSDSASEKPLMVQLPAAEQFDYCAGAGELFIQTTVPAVHRLTETDQSRTLNIGSVTRLALDSLTASHPLRQRGASEAPMSSWFTEDGLACDIGVSPIETFIQAEMLHLQQQAQRTLLQLRRLSRHLTAHCPQLEPLEALHHEAQADAWTAQYGQTAATSLYRLLECTLTHNGTTQTVHEFFTGSATQMPAFNSINWPHLPTGLQLLQTIAEIADAASETGSNEKRNPHLLERLAVLDLLMRDPAASDANHAHHHTQEAAHVRILLTANERNDVRRELGERLFGLKEQLERSGLIQSTPHLEGKACNAAKHA